MAEETKQEAAPAAAAPSGDKVPLQSRIIGTLIDGIIAAVAGTIVGTVVGMVMPAALFGITMALQNAVTAAVYLLRDSILGEGQSPGKKVMKYRVLGPDGKPCSQELAIKRNLPLAAGAICGVALGIIAIVPVIGWIGAAFGGMIVGVLSLAVVCAEIYFIHTDPQGNRWGDKFAGTTTQKVA